MGAYDDYGSLAYPNGAPTIFDSSAPQRSFIDPRALFFLGMGQGLLRAGGPSPYPTGFGTALGQGMEGALSNVMAGQAMNQRQQMVDAQLADRQQKAVANQQRAQAILGFANQLPEDQRPAFLAAPDAYLKEHAKRLFAPPQLVERPTGVPGVSVQQWLKPGETSGPQIGGEKQPEILNPAVQEAKAAVAAAGRPTVNVNVANKVGESLAGKVGDIAQSGQASAAGAVDVVDTVNRVRAAIDKGNVNLGPTATLRNKADQFAQVMGVGGADTSERLVNTRNVIRGLAQFTVGARKQLKGQGQVSDYEGKLLQRAESGEIDDFTLPELKDFLGVTEKIARKAHSEHKRILGVMGNSKDEEVRGLVPYFDVPDLPPTVKAASPAAIKRYNPATGRIE